MVTQAETFSSERFHFFLLNRISLMRNKSVLVPTLANQYVVIGYIIRKRNTI